MADLPRGWSGPPPAAPGWAPGQPPAPAGWTAAPPAPPAWTPAPPTFAPGPPHGAPPPAAAGPPPPRGDVDPAVGGLRPLAFPDLLDGAFAVYRATARTGWVVVAAAMVPLQLLTAFLQRDALGVGLFAILDDPAAAQAGDGALATPGTAAAVAVQLLVVPVVAGALTAVAQGRMAGRALLARDAWALAGRRAGWLVGAYLLTVIGRGAIALLGLLAIVTGADAAAVLLLLLGIPLALALTPPVAVITPAIMAADRPDASTVLDAVRLAWRGWGRAATVVLGTSLVFALVAGLLAGIPNVLGFAIGGGYAWVLVGGANVIQQLVTLPLTAAAMVLLHTDLRVRQEGLDLRLLAARVRRGELGPRR